MGSRWCGTCVRWAGARPAGRARGRKRGGGGRGGGALTSTLKWHLPSGADASGVTGFLVSVYDVTQAKFYSYSVAGATATEFTLPAGVLKAGDQVVWNVRVVSGTVSGGPST